MGRVSGILVVAALLVGGCGSDDKGSSGVTVLQNQGDVCLFSDTVRGVLADVPTTIAVTFDFCSNCGVQYADQSCAFNLDGGLLTVTSAATRTATGGGGACPAVCIEEFVECGGPTLAFGDYAVSHGLGEFSFSVPSSGPAGSCPNAVFSRDETSARDPRR